MKKNKTYFISILLSINILLIVSCVFPKEDVVDPPGTKDLSSPPGAPLEVTYSELSFSSAKISWKNPSDTGKAQDGEDASLESYELQYDTSPRFSNPTVLYVDGQEIEIPNLLPKTTYFFRVRSFNNNKDESTRASGFTSLSSPQDSLSTPDIPPLSKPLNVSVEADPSNSSLAKITWETPASPGKDVNGSIATVVKYRVDYSEDSTFSTLQGSVDNIQVNSLNVSNLSPKTTYYVKVFAFNSVTLNSESDVFSFVTEDLSTPPTAEVTSLNAIVVSTTEIDLEWVAPPIDADFGKESDGSAASAEGYIVYASTSDTFDVDDTIEKRISDNAMLTQRFDNLTPNTTYYFRVRVVNSGEIISQSSPETSSTTMSAVLASSAPTGLILDPSTTLTKDEVSLVWTAPTFVGLTPAGIDATIKEYIVEYKLETDPDTAYMALNTNPTSTSATVTGLSTFTNYSFRVKAVTSEGEVSVYSDVYTKRTASEVEVPSIPTSVTASSSGASDSKTGIEVSWTAPTSTGKNDDGTTGSIDKYELQYKTSSSTSWTDFSGSIITGLNAEVTGLTPYTLYDFRVRAVNTTPETDQISEYGETQVAERTASAASPPASPTNVASTTSGVSDPKTQINVSWVAPADTGKNDDGSTGVINNYELEYLQSPSTTDWTPYTASTITGTSVLVTSLAVNTSYKFRVRAVNTSTASMQESGYTETSTPTTTASAATSPSNPTNVASTTSGVSDSKTQIKVEWQASSSGGKNDDGSTGVIDKYELQYRKASTTTWTDYTGSTITSTNVLVTGLTSGTPYDFRVRAVNTTPSVDRASGYTETSSSTSTTSAATLPSNPTNVVSTTSGVSDPKTQMKVTWSAPSDTGTNDDGTPGAINQYALQYRVSPSGTWKDYTGGLITSTNVLITGLTPSTSYDFKVRAANTTPVVIQISEYGETQVAEKTASAASPPASPTSVVANMTGVTDPTTQMKVTWVAPSDTGTNDNGSTAIIDSYEVEYRLAPSGSWISASPTTNTEQIVQGLTPSTPYDFRVRAVNSTPITEQKSGYNRTNTFTKTASGAEAPGEPTNFQVSIPQTATIQNEEDYNKVALTWNAPTDTGKKDDGTTATIDHYEVYWKKLSDPVNTSFDPTTAQFTKFATEPQGNVTSQDFLLGNISDVAGRTYAFKIVAFTSALINNKSSEVEATYLMPDRIATIDISATSTNLTTIQCRGVRLLTTDTSQDYTDAYIDYTNIVTNLNRTNPEDISAAFFMTNSNANETGIITVNNGDGVRNITQITMLLSYPFSTANVVTGVVGITANYVSGKTVTGTDTKTTPAPSSYGSNPASIIIDLR